MQKGRSSELESLIVDDQEQAIDSVLKTVLEPFVGFTREGRFVTKPSFLKLSHANRILVALLARQAMTRLQLHGAKPAGTPAELHDECMVPLKSCRELLSRLKAGRLIDKTPDGYVVPIWAIQNAAEVVAKG